MTPGIQIVSVECNHCGAPLQVSESTRFVTCTHCNSRLAVHQTASARFTEEIKSMAEDLSVIRLQNELEQLDREWLMQREQWMVQGKDGSKHLPGGAGGLIAFIMAGVFVVFWIGFALQMGAPAVFPLFGVGMLVFMAFGAISSLSKAGNYDKGLAAYESRRRRLLAKIAESNRGR